MTANATQFQLIPGSAFRYDLTAAMVSDTQMKVTFQTTQNPGMYAIGVGIFLDDDADFHGNKISDCIDTDMEKGVLKASFSQNHKYVASNISYFNKNAGVDETTQKFSISYTIDIHSDSTAPHKISCVVFSYYSNTEDIHKSYDFQDISKFDSTFEAYPYVLGDLDNNKKIDMDDALMINKIYKLNGNSPISVSTLNTYLKYNTTSNINGVSVNWKSQFPELICAEVADANSSKWIDQKDMDDVLQYYADCAAGLSPETLIGTNQLKTITI